MENDLTANMVFIRRPSVIHEQQHHHRVGINQQDNGLTNRKFLAGGAGASAALARRRYSIDCEARINSNDFNVNNSPHMGRTYDRSSNGQDQYNAQQQQQKQSKRCQNKYHNNLQHHQQHHRKTNSDSASSKSTMSTSGSCTGISCSDDGDSSTTSSGEPNLPYPGFPEIALKYLTQDARPRNWCLLLITNPWFERVSILVILLNCITLGMYQPCVDDDCVTNRCKVLQVRILQIQSYSKYKYNGFLSKYLTFALQIAF